MPDETRDAEPSEPNVRSPDWVDESDMMEKATTETPEAVDARTTDEPDIVIDTREERAEDGEAGAGTQSTDAMSDSTVERTLLPDKERDSLAGAWDGIQGRFVDEPRQAVAEADRLVGLVMERLTETFARERDRLEAMWDRGEEVNTENLRVALQRYREFFQRLLAA